MTQMKPWRHALSILALSAMHAGIAAAGGTAAEKPKGAVMTDQQRREDYQAYLEFFEEVYHVMDENYYFPIERQDFDRFLTAFDREIFPKLAVSQKSDSYIKWRSSAYLVDFIKAEEDVFSAFFPPKAADEYEQEVLGKRMDLGITGVIMEQGFAVMRVEPRSDAYQKGLRSKDVIVSIDGDPVIGMDQQAVEERLTPLEGRSVQLEYVAYADRQVKTIACLSKEYFKQTVFMVPVDVPQVFCLKIERFNRKTAEDLTRFMSFILNQGETGLIIDLRDNPGGPPLAAREISSFFLAPEEEFAYFQKKNHPRSVLDVPRIPESYHYHGDMVILVNEKSGSASELFSGVLQSRGRAVLMGQNTAGQVLLKSMFHFDDESMVLLVTARGFRPDGTVFSFQGLDPDRAVDPQSTDLVNVAAYYLQEQMRKKPEERPETDY